MAEGSDREREKKPGAAAAAGAEERRFEAAPEDDPYDLADVVRPKRGISKMQAVIAVGMIGFAAYCTVHFSYEYLYALSGGTPRDLGAIDELFRAKALDRLEDNTYVRLSGDGRRPLAMWRDSPHDVANPEEDPEGHYWRMARLSGTDNRFFVLERRANSELVEAKKKGRLDLPGGGFEGRLIDLDASRKAEWIKSGWASALSRVTWAGGEAPKWAEMKPGSWALVVGETPGSLWYHLLFLGLFVLVVAVNVYVLVKFVVQRRAAKG